MARACADYGFEYSEDEVEEEDVDIENQYYNSKGKNLILDQVPGMNSRHSCQVQACKARPHFEYISVLFSSHHLICQTPAQGNMKLS